MHQKSGIHKSSIDRGKSACQNYQIRHCQIWQLHWRQHTLLKITKIRHSQWWQNTLLEIPKIWQVTLLEVLNPALPNASNYTGGKAPW
jgi:hypothetical protein